MKKTFKSIIIIATATAMFASCAKEIQAPAENDEELIEVTLIAGNPEAKPATRTEMDGTTPKWSASDSIGVSSGTSGNYRFDTDIVAAAVTASFSGSSVSGDLYAYHPYGEDGVRTASGATGARVNLIKDQYPTATSFDGNADLMVSKKFTVSPANTTVSGLQFGRLGAIVKIVLIDSEDTMSGTQYPSSVSMTAESALAGYVIIDMVNQSMTDPYYNTSNTVTANYTNETHFAVNGTNGAYLIVAPQTLAAGTSLTIAASTDDYSISKTISVPAGGIELLPGKVNTLNISLAAGHITPKSTPYELYTSAITEGDYLIVSDGAAMKASISSNRFQYSAVSITDDKIFNPDDDCIWHIARSGEYWTIYNADTDKYAAGTGTKNQGALINPTTDNALWSLTYSEGWSIVNKSNSEASVNANIRRNGTSGFATYAANYGTAPVLYKLNDGKSDAEISYARSSDEITEGDPLTPPALSNTHGLAITCTSDNTSVATVNATTGAISVVGGVGTAVITVSWVEQTISTVTYRAGSTTYTLTINAAGANDGSLEHPYTVTEALAIIAGYSHKQQSDTKVYVSGIVAQVGSYNSTYHSVTYDISVDGTTTNMLNVYSGKNVGNTDFSSASEIAVNDEVIVYGYLYLYNSTKEMYQNSYISSLNGTKYLAAGSLEVSTNNATKQITVTWGAASGSSETISYSVTCGAQNYVASAAGDHTFTMADYGTYTVTVVASTSDATSATASTSATISAPSSWTRVTSVATLLAGGTFIIGYEATANSGVIVPMANIGTATTSAAGYMYSGSTATDGGSGTINMSSVATTSSFEVTIGESSEVDGAIYIKIGDNYLGNTNTKNNCKLFASEAATTSFTPTIGDNDNFTLDIAANTSGKAYRYLKYNTSSPRFAVYSTTPEKIVIYKKN